MTEAWVLVREDATGTGIEGVFLDLEKAQRAEAAAKDFGVPAHLAICSVDSAYPRRVYGARPGFRKADEICVTPFVSFDSDVDLSQSVPGVTGTGATPQEALANLLSEK